MKIVKTLSLLVIFSLLSCIDNDIPLPVIKPSITAFEVTGATSAVINEEKREILVTLEEATNIKKVALTKFTISDNTQSMSPVLAAGSSLDLREDVLIKLTTYQEYTWTIHTIQDIKREFVFDGQVGVTTFNAKERIVIAYISSESDISKVKVTSLRLAAGNSTITPAPTTVTDFSMTQTFTVTNHGEIEMWQVYIFSNDSAVETYVPRQLWARRVEFHGSSKAADGVQRGFEWKKASDEQWTKVEQAAIKFSGSEMSALLDFEPATAYVYRAYFGELYGTEKPFETPAAPTIPNLNMDAWSESGKIKFPYGTGETPFWITGNDGVAGFGDSNSVSTTDAVAGKAAKLQTVTVPAVGLAAGNLYTGEFKTDLANPLNSTKWGRAFSGRPRQVAGMFKYTQKVIDVASKRPDAKGTPDKGIAWIKLEDWKGATGLRPDNAEVLAHSVYHFDKNVTEYTRFEFDVKYSSTKTPTHITLCFSSSYLGDFYTGGVGSTLYIDNIELIY